MNKSMEKFYKQFERPPFAPTYCPTEEEFLDPIAYVAKIKPEAERYGVVKIRPPPTFRPPFAIESERFEFTPRVQKLNRIEGPVRSRLIFEAEIADFWHMQGVPLQVPLIENKHIDMFKFTRTVINAGGSSAVTQQKRWPQIAKQLGLKSCSGSKLMDVHTKWIAPYEQSLRESLKEEYCQGSASGECAGSMDGRRRIQPSKSRMMAGISAPPKEEKIKKSDPMDDVICRKCHSGEDEDRLLMCEDCDYPLHIYCCDPPLPEVPKAEWRCRKCVVTALRGIADTFGFHDSHTHYNLVSFAEFASQWKRSYFQEDLLDVTSEIVEKEYWSKVIDAEATVAVKYGADLLATKVGSGFSMPKCDSKSSDDRKDKEYYAQHPWNLNNLPVLKESVLSFMESGISGMMVPWVYVGMCFSTFCWHTEDHWTYSINYLHWGEKKIWYGVSGYDAEKFEEAVRSIVPDLFERQPDLLHHMTTTINPCLLMSKDVQVHTVHQEAGDFVITFPRAFHAGYNEGLNFAEAVNFAPADWLRIGRNCIADYARVRRHCVFSHEELVLRMAKSVGELSADMCIAVHEELHELVQRERTLREKVARSGISSSSSREEFEKVADDMRCCVVCRTTVFMSAVCCSHGRLSCLNHFDQVCSQCPREKLSLKYRYTLDELDPILNELADRTCGYSEWREKVLSTLNRDAKGKPAVEDLRALVDLAAVRRYPHCSVIDDALSALKSCDEVASLINAHLSAVPRNASKNALPVVELRTFEDLKSKLESLPCRVDDLSVSVCNFFDNLNKWKIRCEAAFEAEGKESTSRDDLIDEVCNLLDERAKIPVRDFEKLENQLKNMLNRLRWVVCAEKLLRWNKRKELGESSKEDCNEDFDSDDERYCSRGRWKLQKVMDMVNEGSQHMKEYPYVQDIVNEIHKMMKLGYMDEHAAETLMSNESNEGAGAEEAERRWNEFRRSDWMSEENIDTLRKEVVRARRIRLNFLKVEGNGDYSLKELNELQVNCIRSTFVDGSELHIKVKLFCDRLRIFCTRVHQLFVRTSSSYYSVFEILSGRDDLQALIDGSPLPLHQYVLRNSNDCWTELARFESNQELKDYLRSIDERQCDLMLAVRQANEARSIRETCSCCKDGAEGEPFMDCFLCHAKYHASCIIWNSYLNCLPVGHFLCVRCVRGQRPCTDDVCSALSYAPPSLERTLVSNALERSVRVHKEALELINSLEPGADQFPPGVLESVDKCLISVLCAEVMDLDAWSLIAACIPRVHPVDDERRATFAEIRIRPVPAQLPTTLFANVDDAGEKKKGKRSSSLASSEFFTSVPHRKRPNELHSENETCSAERCFGPHGDHLRWIQCESGCSRWYHYVCVGLTVKQAKNLSSYCCYRCSSDAASQRLAVPSSASSHSA